MPVYNESSGVGLNIITSFFKFTNVTLYDVSVSAINQHLKRIFEDNELIEEAVIKKYLITATDGKSYSTKHYNLQAIIAVGF